MKIDICQNGRELPAFVNAMRSIRSGSGSPISTRTWDQEFEMIVREFLVRFKADLYYEDYAFKHLIFANEVDATEFLLRWS